MDWAKNRFKEALKKRKWGLALLYGFIFIVGFVLLGLCEGRLETWANTKIDNSREAAMNSLLAFIASDTFLLILAALFVLIWAGTFLFLYRRTVPSITPSIAPIAQVEPQNRSSEILEWVVVEGRRRDNLALQKFCQPYRVLYPIHIRNTRSDSVEILGYDTTFKWNDAPIKRVSWKAPDTKTSDGLDAFVSREIKDRFIIQPDSADTLEIPVQAFGIAVPNGSGSPTWGAEGTIKFKAGENEKEVPFDFSTDHYQLDDWDWIECIAIHP